MLDLSKDLNPSQRAAVEQLQGPLLILAGAGSGKTRVLTSRMANLILQGEASPTEILAVTFTNKAAREMEHRVISLLRQMQIPVYDRLWVSTFHSICSRILRQEIHLLGYQPFFVIYDDSDQLAVIKKALEEHNLNDKVYPPKQVRQQISGAKMLGLKPDDVVKKPFYVMDDAVIDVYETYEAELKSANALDFDDLLLKTYELFRLHPSVLQSYRERFRYIMVDEYQDTNHIQYLLIKILAEEHRNLCVVGDEDQSIYSWRGADIRNILDFEKDFPEAKVVKLEENYRSTKTIVEAASHVIRQNTQRKDKTLFTNNEAGNKIVIQGENNEYDEARFVTRRIQDLRSGTDYTLNDFAVFYRTNAQSRVLEEQLRNYSIPYRLIGSVRFYDRMEIKDIICYLRLMLNANDDVAFYRVINVPARGIGKTTIEKVQSYQAQHKISAAEACLAVAEQRLVNAGAAGKLRGFCNLLELLRSFAPEHSVSDLYVKILDETGYAVRLKEENTAESQARIDNLEELQNAIFQFEKERGDEATLQMFLEELALVSDADRDTEDEEAVTLMTLHLSKGLEFKNVFVVGMEEGLFPSSRRLDESDPTAFEEERRLAYVGMTRARENLHLSFARVRRVWGQEETRPMSRFISEIPPQYVTHTGGLRKPHFLTEFENRNAGQFAAAPAGAAPAGAGSAGVKSPRSPAKSPRGFLRKAEGAPPAYEHFSDENFSDDLYDSSSTSPTNSEAFQKGQRVRHPIFGVGSIFQVEGAGDTRKVSVLFQDRSLRKFMIKHARLEIVGS
jgi:DNA helicase II / ATP-dependent DNA helicase PcrA